MGKRLLTLWIALGWAIAGCSASDPDVPNIILFYADDLGYGDLGCYGATRVRTPSLDGLAAGGLRFTDAHSAAGTCTPSRYGLLTGNYPFRERRAQVLPGDAPLLIPPGQLTLASMLQAKGYRTGVVGKWHLGLGAGNLDWNAEIRPGPLELGFDYAFLVPATGDRVPCVYVENRRVVGLNPEDPIRVSYRDAVGAEPIGAEHPELLRVLPSHGHDRTIINGISRIGYMSGGRSARWVDEDMADVLTEKAVSFLREQSGKPFFLYFAFHDIHVPRVPHARFVGKSEMGPRGDAIAQLDWCVGEVLSVVEDLGLTRNTLVMFTSDNGPVVDDGYRDEAVERLGGHRPAGPLRGGKYSNFEGGTRVPLIVSWPGRVQSGTSDALIGQVDFLASFAELIGSELPAQAARDSVNLMPALLGDTREGRRHLVEQAGTLSLRLGPWKWIPPSGGPRVSTDTDTELGNDPSPQLYELTQDLGETRNLAAMQPGKVREMQELLDRLKGGSSSRD